MSKVPPGSTPPEDTHTSTEVRQGRRGWMMLLVLFASLSLIIIVFALTYLFAEVAEDPTSQTRNEGTTSSVTTQNEE